jgi:hypothetical protein
MPHWVPGSTQRIAQLTGDYDPEFRTHFATTSRWGVAGVDLGANTEHDGRTFIFFGDVVPSPGVKSPPGPPLNSDLVAFIEDTPFPRGGHLAVERQSDHQLDVFFIGTDGALYVSWVIDGETWQGPVRISRPGMAPAGGGVAAAKQSADQLDVFFIGRDGALYVSWVVGGGIWQGPLRLSGRGVAPAGGQLTAVHQGSQQLDVLYIGNDHRLNVHWVGGLDDWQGPVSLGTDPVAPPGGALASIEQVPNQVSVLFIGHDQKLNVQWVIGGGVWQGPVSLGAQPVAPAGAHLAAIKQLPNQTSVLFIGNDHKLNVQWVVGGGTWQGPVALSPQPVAPPGAGIALVTQVSNQTTALFLGELGQLFVQWVIGGGVWQGPVAISPPDVAPRGAPIVVAKQLPSLTTAVYSGPTGQMHVSWVIAGGTWQGPVPINPDMVKLTPVLQDGVFHPFTLREGARTWMILGDGTPTGAFSYDGKVFVFAVANEGVTVSSLTKSCCPAEPVPFDLVFKFSFESDLDGGKFFQVSPCVVGKADVPELEVEGSEGAILLGHGFTRREPPFGVNLAWLPLAPGRDPDLQSIRYFNGHGPHGWSPNEGDAVPLFGTQFGWASMSVGRVPGANVWILLYHTAGLRSDLERAGSADRPIVARLASRPWELGNAPEIPILDPVRDHALGHYMYRANRPDPNNLAVRGVPIIDHPSFLYGPHLLNRYTRFDAATRTITIFYLVSTGKPYQVQLMQSSIQLDG